MTVEFACGGGVVCVCVCERERVCVCVLCRWLVFRAASDAQFHVFDALEPKVHPFKVHSVHGVDPINLQVRGVLLYSLKLCTVHQL